jgi:hypothetical protein
MSQFVALNMVPFKFSLGVEFWIDFVIDIRKKSEYIANRKKIEKSQPHKLF